MEGKEEEEEKEEEKKSNFYLEAPSKTRAKKYFKVQQIFTLQDVRCTVQTLKSNVLRTLMGLDNKIS